MNTHCSNCNAKIEYKRRTEILCERCDVIWWRINKDLYYYKVSHLAGATNSSRVLQGNHVMTTKIK